MTPEKEAFLQNLLTQLVPLIEQKFKKGDIEHTETDELMLKDALELSDDSLKETIDLLIYQWRQREKIIQILDKRRKIDNLLQEALGK